MPTPGAARLRDLVVLCLRAYEQGGPLEGARTRDRYQALACTDRWTLFLNQDSRALVVAFRGTALRGLQDLGVNMHVLRGTFGSSGAFRAEWHALQAALRVAPCGAPVVLTGHSNGATFAAAAYDQLLALPDPPKQVVVVGFNPATSPAALRPGASVPLPPRPKQVLHYLVERDPVSRWHRGLCGHLVHVPARRGEPCLERHNLRAMLARRLKVPPRFRHMLR